MLKKYPSDKINITKFRIPSCFYQTYFCSTKSMDSLTLRCHNSFKNINNRKATHSLLPDL